MSGEQPRPRRSWKQRLLLLASSLGVIAALTSAAALFYVRDSYQQITRIADPEVDAALAAPLVPAGAALDPSFDPGKAKNFLLVGTDSDEGLDPDDPVTIGRNDLSLNTDTMIVLRIDPENDSAAMLSIPRDLWVPIAGTNKRNRVNAALASGGPQGRARLIETIENYLEFDINHYIEINFLGFRELVDDLGGVPIYFQHPARDFNTGLDILEPGCHTLDSVDALAYARSRKYWSHINGKWVQDPTADLGRNARQQHFIRQSLRRSVSLTGRNLLQMGELIGSGVDSVSLDSSVKVRDLLALASHFRNYDPDELPSYALPVSDRVIRGEQVLELREDAAQTTLDVFRGLEEGEISPRSTRVAINNGTGTSGEAGEFAELLEAEGFKVTQLGDNRQFNSDVATIEHRPKHRAEAVLLATYLEGEVRLVRVDTVRNADIRLTTAPSLEAVRDTPVERPELAPTTTTTTTAPTTTTTQPETDSADSGGEVTTTTTVPVDPAVARAARFGVVTDLPDGVSCG